jgi:hypothetical protein
MNREEALSTIQKKMDGEAIDECKFETALCCVLPVYKRELNSGYLYTPQRREKKSK